MKKILVTGANGQLGYDVVKRLSADGFDVRGVDIGDFDITDAAQTENFIRSFEPDVVVHCSAYTAVDKAESEPELCGKANAFGAENIARACRALNASMVYISTDYVYGGTGESPIEATEAPAPLSVYGRTKLEGEEACKKLLKKLYIIRTSWVFGKNGGNFVKTMLNLGRERDSLNVVCDQIGSPTYTVDLADFIAFIIRSGKYGTYHFTNEGFCSWYDFAREIFRLSGISTAVKAVPTSEYKTVAKRPLNSRLSKKSVFDAGYPAIPTWQDALERYLEEIRQ
ncbi:MAG: dTDP-4-dehydrorhamnose reductase [Firmicutes bacterium]|nr:dTDP-4-dehydrorhamnose reductase [Bacillota bacterium]